MDGLSDRVDEELQQELQRLRLATVRRLRERLEDPEETATPSYLEVARKLVADLAPPAPAARRLPAITDDLPFAAPEDE